MRQNSCREKEPETATHSLLMISLPESGLRSFRLSAAKVAVFQVSTDPWLVYATDILERQNDNQEGRVTSEKTEDVGRDRRRQGPTTPPLYTQLRQPQEKTAPGSTERGELRMDPLGLTYRMTNQKRTGQRTWKEKTASLASCAAESLLPCEA